MEAAKAYNQQFESYGPYRYPDGVTYFGEYRNHKRQGRGLLFTSNGQVFDGFWQNEDFTYGRVTSKLGETYLGDMKGGKKHGKGELLTSENWFKRDWKDDQFVNGTKKILEDGSYYLGCFKDLKPHGLCEFHCDKTKSHYSGGFKAGLREGKGKELFSNGSTYEGMYRKDMMDGFGLLVTDVGTYTGQIKCDKREGKGTFVYKDGSKYEGSFAADKFDGAGKLTKTTGVQFEGIFKNNNQHGKFKVTYPNSSNPVMHVVFVDGVQSVDLSARI